jgi:hypothetical protein
VNVTGTPLAVEGAVGLMLIAVMTALVTVKFAADDVMPLNEAVIEVLPAALPVATPVALLIVATPPLLEDQATKLVRFVVLLSV